MDKITDEMLVAFADGELGDAEYDEVASRVAVDPVLARRLSVFTTTGRGLSQLYEQELQEPIPDRLMEIVDRYVPTADTTRANVSRTRGRSIFEVLFGGSSMQAPFWQGALAVCLALVAGAVMGSQFGDAFRPGAQENASAMVAQGAFHKALELAPSGGSSEPGSKQSGGGTLKPVLTFASRDGGFCREYQQTSESGHTFFGVACRDPQGDWQVRLHVPGRAQKDQGSRFVPASAAQSEAIDALVDDLIVGDVFSSEKEKSLIQEGWQISQ